MFFFVFELGSLLCAVATSSPFFIVGRAVAGLGVSGLQNGSLTIVAGAVPLQKRACRLCHSPKRVVTRGLNLTCAVLQFILVS